MKVRLDQLEAGDLVRHPQGFWLRVEFDDPRPHGEGWVLATMDNGSSYWYRGAMIVDYDQFAAALKDSFE